MMVTQKRRPVCGESFFGFLLTACESSWEIKDHDGDGQTLLDGDCWNSLEDPVPPANALDHGVTAAQIYQGAEDLPYDGLMPTVMAWMTLIRMEMVLSHLNFPG